MPDLALYTPQAPRRFALEPGEAVRHTFLLRGFRWLLERGEPERSIHFGHLTSQRFVLEPADSASTESPISIPWNDVIEFEFAEGSLAQQRIPGIEDHMIHCSTKQPQLDAPTELFLFTCGPVAPERIADPRAHGEAFIQLADDLMLDAFE
jgi:hypothetical protein